MANITYDVWSKALPSYGTKVVHADVGGSPLDISVMESVPLRAQVLLVRSVVDACKADGDMRPELFEYAFRSCVVGVYTNIEFGDATIDDIWRLVGDDSLYGQVVAVILDDVARMRNDARALVVQAMSKADELAARVLTAMNIIQAILPEDIITDISDIVEQLGDIIDSEKSVAEKL